MFKKFHPSTLIKSPHTRRQIRQMALCKCIIIPSIYRGFFYVFRLLKQLLLFVCCQEFILYEKCRAAVNKATRYIKHNNRGLSHMADLILEWVPGGNLAKQLFGSLGIIFTHGSTSLGPVIEMGTVFCVGIWTWDKLTHPTKVGWAISCQENFSSPLSYLVLTHCQWCKIVLLIFSIFQFFSFFFKFFSSSFQPFSWLAYRQESL